MRHSKRVFSPLIRFFGNAAFRRDSVLTRPLDVVLWWEERRVLFNVVVGSVGCVGGILIVACAVLAEPLVGEAIGIPDGPILAVFGILAYAIMANVCYTLGWIVELAISRFVSPFSIHDFGLRAFRLGLKFSIGLTLIPAVAYWGVFLFRLASLR